MNAEIIAVGSELLLGQIVNTNTRFISTKLAEIGINVFYHTVVGDNRKRFIDAVKIAEARADLIIFTGGLGPTKDDLTKEALAEHLQMALVHDEEALLMIQDFFAKRGHGMTENNKKQALVLEGSHVLSNLHGMAPGMFLTLHRKNYLLLPGPPMEMEPMFVDYAIPLLSSDSTITSRVLRFYGIGEAELETRILDLLESQTDPTIAPLASDGEVTLRLTTKNPNVQFATKKLDEIEAKITDRVGDFLYGYDSTSLMEEVCKLLKKENLTISAAESFTGGLFQQELTAIPGVSAVFPGGIVSYSNLVKMQVLGVEAEIIRDHGVVSEECALSMARSVRQLFHTDIGVSFTGVAGPDELEGKSVGTVFIGFSFQDGRAFTQMLQLGLTRNSNRIRAVKQACSILLKKCIY